MERCVMIGAGDCPAADMKIEKGSLYIAVDGGYAYCKKLGISPGLIIGDMDSLTEGESLCSKGSRNGSLREEIERIEMLCPEKVIRLCKEKDDTDMLAALKIGMEKGYRDFSIYGALGGRIEHSIANIQCLVYLRNHGAKGRILDNGVEMFVIQEESVVFDREMEGYLSLFALGEKVEGVTIAGMKYPLKDATITNDYPIGISNEFVGQEGMIEVKKGMALLILSTNKERT